MSYFFIKLHHEILHDAKMCRLTDNLWRRAIEMFLLAGETGKKGYLPSLEDMAWTLRISAEELEANLNSLAKCNIVSLTPDGWHVTHFEKRQAAIEGKTRVSGFRERAKKQDYYAPETEEEQSGNEPVTSRYTDIELELDIDKELEKNKPAKPVKSAKIDKSALLIKDTSSDLQDALEKAYQSLGRKTPLYFKNEQQRDAYRAAIGALNGQSKILIDKGISRERTSLSALLAWLETCVKNQNGNGAAGRIVNTLERHNGNTTGRAKEPDYTPEELARAAKINAERRAREAADHV